MPPLAHTLFYFLLAIAVLVAFHEYGHFFACRRLGVKVIRFSIGIGKSIWSYRKNPEDTEFSIGLLPLGGYVKMVDEREGSVSEEDLPHAFNRQSVAVRSAIVFAGPFANFLLAVLLFWFVLMLGETGLKPILGTVNSGTLAAEAGFQEGDEIIAINGVDTPTWNLAIAELVEQATDRQRLSIEVKSDRESNVLRTLEIPEAVIDQPNQLFERLGFQPWQPALPPVIDRVEPNSAAANVGLLPGDYLISADGIAIKDWQQWVNLVKSKPGQPINLKFQRETKELEVSITPAAVDSPKGKIGKIGAAVVVPENLQADLMVEYKLAPLPAFARAWSKTFEYSALTVKMIGRLIVGQASVDNLSGPISIAQYAGKSASMGLAEFLRFLALISISLAVLNLLPIPVLDGGHLFFYAIEAIRGKPLPETAQILFQNIGIAILFTLMAFSFYLDLVRHPV